MDQRTVEVIRKKLDYLERTLAEIGPYLQARYADYAQQPANRRATERLVQIIIEAVADTSELIVQAAGRPAPGSMREALHAIRDLAVIGDALFERFNRTYIGLRNRIVHDYDTLDNRILFNSAKRLRKDAREFLKSIILYLASAYPKEPGAHG
ncbi:MAG TPA: DUF86 domain-containing protein [Anaerolineae bacterium]|nr:DUF86 domain-containing protein [Anaerolineae bacterium]